MIHIISSILSFLVRFLPLQQVYAHCDIPCGIYTPEPSLTASKTVLKMVEKMTNLPQADENDSDSMRNFHNAMARYVMVKEEHAQKCKEELLILWTDYFKPEHLAAFPDLHETFWKAAKLCSKNKQEVNLVEAQNLVKAVEEIAEMFHKAEAAKAA